MCARARGRTTKLDATDKVENIRDPENRMVQHVAAVRVAKNAYACVYTAGDILRLDFMLPQPAAIALSCGHGFEERKDLRFQDTECVFIAVAIRENSWCLSLYRLV